MKMFAIIGVVGFLVDAVTLKAFLFFLEDNVMLGRGFSFPIAVTVTWFLNQRYTFSVEGKPRPLYQEWFNYILVNSIGLGVNIAIFSTVIFYFDTAKYYPIFTLGVASLIAMFFNYFGSKYWVFERKFSV